MSASVLDKILDQKRVEISAAKKVRHFEQVVEEAKSAAVPRGFAAKLRSASYPAVIAEIKRASPSKGIIREDLDPIAAAEHYAAAGAACVSILTDKQFFKGELEFIWAVRSRIAGLPILRKDFIIDSYQIWESRAAGADAVLLIVKALSEAKLQQLFAEAVYAGLDVLIETHSAEELKTALSVLSCMNNDRQTLPLIGINNRNLDTFEVDLETTKEVARRIDEFLELPDSSAPKEKLLLVSESGIYTGEDISRLASYGANAFLVGESLVREGSPEDNLRRLIQSSRDIMEGA